MDSGRRPSRASWRVIRVDRTFMRAPIIAAAVVGGWGLFWALGHALDATVMQPAWRTGIVATTAVGTAAATVAIGMYARRRPAVAADVVVVATSVAVAGLSTMALHGTRWAFASLWGDSYFRTQMATRYSQHVDVVDYSYRDLPAYYPPALGWLQGRAADLLDVQPWEVLKPVQILLAAAIPLLAYVFWQRVLAPLPAALVVSATTMLTAHLQKPDEWLVLACLLPWWLEIVRGARNPSAPEWPAWRHGLVLGLLLLTHTYYFLPLGVATVLGMGMDVVRGRGLALPLRRAILIGIIGLAVSTPYWIGMLAVRLSGMPSDALQLRYGFVGANLPPAPPTVGAGVLWAVAIGWLAWSAWQWRRHDRSDGVAGALAVALGGSYLMLLAGAVAQPFGIGLLAFKTSVLVIAIQTACGVLGLLRVVEWLARRPTHQRAWRVALAVAGALVAASVVGRFTTEWIVGDNTLRAQITRYPDGSWPDGGAGFEPFWYPARVMAGDPSVEQVVTTWDRLSGGLPRSETVLAVTRVDVLATTPVYAFLPLKSIYSHPFAQFEARVALLRRVADCPDPACAAELLADNPYDRIDGLVLERVGSFLRLAVYVDNFPNLHSYVPVDFPARLFQEPYFRRSDLGRISVIAVR